MVTDAVNPPRIRQADGSVTEVQSRIDLLMRFSLLVPTFLPRSWLIGVVQWAPLVDAAAAPPSVNVGTSLSGTRVAVNAPALIYGAMFDLLRQRHTGGWVSGSLGLLGMFSPAAEKDDDSFYTHKLLAEVFMTIGIFNWLSDGQLLRNLTLYSAVEYIATGLPTTGAPTSAGGQLLGNADPWIFIVGLQVPVAPTPIAR
jgi:hypothetical protein